MEEMDGNGGVFVEGLFVTSVCLFPPSLLGFRGLGKVLFSGCWTGFWCQDGAKPRRLSWQSRVRRNKLSSGKWKLPLGHNTNFPPVRACAFHMPRHRFTVRCASVSQVLPLESR